MSGGLSLAAWLAQVDGQPVGSGECVALADSYAVQVVGSPVISAAGGTHNEYASSMWEAFGANGTGNWYRQVSPLLPMLPGDVCVWRFGSAVAPFSHVAVGLQDLGVAVLVESQNTNGHRWAEKTTLPKAGLYGYLRPLNSAQVDGVGIHAAADVQGAGNPLTQFAALGSAWGKSLAWLGDAKSWQRIGIGLLGIILIMVVLVKILGPSPAGAAVGTFAQKAVNHVRPH